RHRSPWRAGQSPRRAAAVYPDRPSRRHGGVATRRPATSRARSTYSALPVESRADGHRAPARTTAGSPLETALPLPKGRLYASPPHLSSGPWGTCATVRVQVPRPARLAWAPLGGAEGLRQVHEAQAVVKVGLIGCHPGL